LKALQTIAEERESYKGGICEPYRTRAKFCISIDVNSSYPGSMHNDMPVRYKNPNCPVKEYVPHKLLTIKNLKFCSFYCAQFKFKKGVEHPTIPVKSDGSIVLVMEDSTWRWYASADLRLAVEKELCEYIIVCKAIHYEEGDKIFREYIVDHFKMRKLAK